MEATPWLQPVYATDFKTVVFSVFLLYCTDMQLFSSNSISLGIAFTDTNVFAVRLDQEKGILLNKHDISPETMLHGVVQNEQDVVEALVHVLGKTEELAKSTEDKTQPKPPQQEVPLKWWQKILQRKNALNTSGDTGAAVCVPPDAVYTALFAIPTIVGKDLQEEVLDRIYKNIPIQPEDMLVTWRQVGKSDDDQHIAVAAMSKTYLRQIESMCSRQKVRLAAISTPASVVWLAAAEKQKENAILICRLPETSATSTFMYNHWPIDELVLPADHSLDEQVQQTKQMIDEQTAAHGIVPRRIVFIGSDEEFAALQQAGFDVPVVRTTFAVPERMKNYELGLFSILSARKDKLMNMTEAIALEEDQS